MITSLAVLTIISMIIWGLLYGLGAVALTPTAFFCVLGLVFCFMLITISCAINAMEFVLGRVRIKEGSSE